MSRPIFHPSRIGPRGVLALAALWAACAQAGIDRGPYLQLAGSTEVTVVFRTGAAGVGKVRYGLRPDVLDAEVAEASAATVHALHLTGLSPLTRYYYAVDVDGLPMAAGPTFTFQTYPAPGARAPFRFFAWGDSGTGGSGQYAVANQMRAALGEAAFALVLGDVIYPAGEWANYDPEYFQPYRELVRRMVFWGAEGNHDMLTDVGAPYLDAFYLPANNPAGTELYYSFDYGDAHFVCLSADSSFWTDTAKRAAQLDWARADLQASSATWKLIYLHRPPYSGGTHPDQADIIAGLVPLVDATNVDVVLAGHSHNYERTYLLKGGLILQNDASRYTKPGAEGALYLVSGTAGQSGAISATHPLMAVQTGNTYGNSVIDVDGAVLRGYFLDSAGVAHDLFTLEKGTDVDPPRVTGVRAGPANTQVALSFSEPVAAGTSPGSAEDVARYAISPTVQVLSAALSSDLRTVTLTTAAHSPGQYALSVTGVMDRAATPNAIAAGTQVRYAFGGVQPGQALERILVARGSTWRWLDGPGNPPANWATTAFDDSAWSAGAAPLGFGETRIATNVPMTAAGSLTFYARQGFQFEGGVGGLQSLALRADYDDGFVAYLNGAEVARRYVVAGQDAGTPASISHESGAFEEFDATPAIGTLITGQNELAVELHNNSLTSSDALLDAELVATVKRQAPYAAEPSPPPGADAVSRTMGISVHVRDDTLGIDPQAISLWVDGLRVEPGISGGPHDWRLSFAPPVPFGPGEQVSVEVDATNLEGAAMEPYGWSFQAATATAARGCACSTGAGPDALWIAALALLGYLRRRAFRRKA